MKVLEVKNIRKMYGKQCVLDNVSFSVKEGEIVGLVGPNGAGKTTVMKIIAGLIPNYSGEVYIKGRNIRENTKMKKKRVGCVIETPGFYPNLSGYENLKFFAEISGLENMNEIDDIVKVLRLDNAIHKKAGKYSLGMKQRIGIAQAALTYPPLLILDEPTNGLDPNIIPEIRRFIKDIAKQKKCSVLISSHVLSELDIMCNKIVFLQKGKILEINDLNNTEGMKFIKITSSECEKIYHLFKEMGVDIISTTSNYINIRIDKNCLEETIFKLSQRGIRFSTVEEVKTKLEDKFLDMMRGDIVE